MQNTSHTHLNVNCLPPGKMPVIHLPPDESISSSPVGVHVDADLADVGVDLADLVPLLQVVPELLHRDLGQEDAVPHAHLGLAAVHLGGCGGVGSVA